MRMTFPFDEPLRLRTISYLLGHRLCVTREDAEDAVQDACLKAWEHRKQFRGDAKFSVWFTRIAINAALMRRRGHAAFISRVAAPLEEAAELAARGRMKDLLLAENLARAILSLCPSKRRAILLHYVAGVDFRTIARTMSRSRSTVKANAHRGRMKLREMLRDVA